MYKYKAELITGVIAILLVIVGVVGYVLNIVTLMVTLLSEDTLTTTEGVVRVIGLLIPPLGAVIGYI